MSSTATRAPAHRAPGSGLDVVGVVLVSCSTVSLIGWRRSRSACSLPLDVATATSQDPQRLRAAYLGMDLIVREVIVRSVGGMVVLLVVLVLNVYKPPGMTRYGRRQQQRTQRDQRRPAPVPEAQQRLPPA